MKSQHLRESLSPSSLALRFSLIKKFSCRPLRIAAEIAFRGSAVLMALFALYGFAPHATAATQTWSGGSITDGNWSDVANWANGAIPGSTIVTTSSDVALFNSAIANGWGASGTPIVIDQTTQNIGGISFDTSAG